MSLAITRRDLSAEGLRGHARRCQDVQQACRLLALAFVLASCYSFILIHRINHAGYR